ncbi:MAG: hypothetical protein AAFV49_09450, partial [Pseudomonadota bacterium]
PFGAAPSLPAAAVQAFRDGNQGPAMKDSEHTPLEVTPELLLRAYAAGVFPMAKCLHSRRRQGRGGTEWSPINTCCMLSHNLTLTAPAPRVSLRARRQ